MGTYLLTSAVAQRLGVSQTTVRHLVEIGDLPAYRVGSQLRFLVADVDAFLLSAKTTRPTLVA